MRTIRRSRSDGLVVAPGVPCAVALAALLTLPLWACADSSPEASGRTEALQLVPLPPIDGGGGPGQMGFGRISDLELGENGEVFVLDGMRRAIRVFDEQGEPLRSFGTRGRGPEELEQPVALTWGPEGRLWVVDAGNGRYAVFDTSGEFVTTRPFQFDRPAMGIEAIRFVEGGSFATVNLEPEGGSLERMKASLVESELTGDEVRERSRTPLPFVEWPPLFRHEAGGSLLVLPVPFSSEPLFRLAPDGSLWYAHTREPWVHRRPPTGGIEQTVGRDFEPPPVTGTDMEQVREDAEELRQASPEAFAELADLIPGTRPHLEGFFLDDVGRVWILRSAPSGDEERTLDVYDGDGTFMASFGIALEPDPVPRVRNGLLVGVVRDELEVESVARYKIRP